MARFVGARMRVKLGIIGGAGLYDIDGLTGADWVQVETPWGAPSDAILCGTLNGVEMAFHRCWMR